MSFAVTEEVQTTRAPRAGVSGRVWVQTRCIKVADLFVIASAPIYSLPDGQGLR